MSKLLKYSNTVSMRNKMNNSYKVSYTATGISRSAKVNPFMRFSCRGITKVTGKV